MSGVEHSRRPSQSASQTSRTPRCGLYLFSLVCADVANSRPHPPGAAPLAPARRRAHDRLRAGRRATTRLGREQREPRNGAHGHARQQGRRCHPATVRPSRPPSLHNGATHDTQGAFVRRYRDAPLTFVNSHLAAFVQNVAQRNAQFRDTAAQLVFPRGPGASPDPSQVWAPDLKPESIKAGGEGWSVWESEALIWLGDLNVRGSVAARLARRELTYRSPRVQYRIDLPRADVDRMVRDKEYDLLLRFDQVRAPLHSRRTLRALTGLDSRKRPAPDSTRARARVSGLPRGAHHLCAELQV